MKALISPSEIQSTITHWADFETPVRESIPNSARVAEVSEQEFHVALPLFWVDCTDDTVADHCYYDTASGVFKAFPAPAERPMPKDQPKVDGAQTI
jgi:hypothetical protein